MPIGGQPDVKLSGVVVTYNDGAHLEECLNALFFCDEIVAVDLGSHDESRDIARRHHARLVDHPHVPAVELVRKFAVELASSEWVVFMDPDMTFPRVLVPQVLQCLGDPSLGVIDIPYRNHFFGRPVRHVRWGGTVRYPALFRRDAMELLPLAHRGFRLKEGYQRMALGHRETEMIIHHWIESRRDLEARIERYAPIEAELRIAAGDTLRRGELLIEPASSFLKSFFVRLGFLDGWRGCYLSWVAARLTRSFAVALRDEQRRRSATMTSGL